MCSLLRADRSSLLLVFDQALLGFAICIPTALVYSTLNNALPMWVATHQSILFTPMPHWVLQGLVISSSWFGVSYLTLRLSLGVELVRHPLPLLLAISNVPQCVAYVFHGIQSPVSVNISNFSWMLSSTLFMTTLAFASWRVTFSLFKKASYCDCHHNLLFSLTK